MTQNRIKQIRNFGQNIWLDYLDREILDSGKLKGMMELIGPETINTVTLETLDAFRDHGRADNR